MEELTNTINSSTLKATPKMVLPTPTQDKTPYEDIIQGAITGLPNVQSQVDQATKDSDSILSNYIANSRETVNKEEFSQNQQNLAGVNDRNRELDALNAQFNDLGAQIKSLVRDKNAIPLKVEQKNFGTGASDEGVAPQQIDMLRENAIKAMTLASQADVLGAQITNTESRLIRAKETAQKAVDLKYKPIEAEITRLKDALELNKNYILEPAEKKLLQKQTIALNERARILEENKQRDKENADLMINANAQGAPASIRAKAQKLIDSGAKPAQVSNVLGVYSGDYIGNQAKLKDMKIKDLEIKIKNNELLQFTGLSVAQNADGTVVKGSGKNATERNINTVEQIVKKFSKTIPDGAQTQIGKSLGVVNSLKDLVNANTSGNFIGMNPLSNYFSGVTPKSLKRDETITNETLIGAIELRTQLWATGASVTKEQEKLIMEMVPKKGDPDNVVKQKVKSLTDMMNSQISAELSSAGVKYRAEPTDYFDESISTKVRNAKGTGYGDTEILDSLLLDPVYGAKIKQARAIGKGDTEIVNYLQNSK